MACSSGARRLYEDAPTWRHFGVRGRACRGCCRRTLGRMDRGVSDRWRRRLIHGLDTMPPSSRHVAAASAQRRPGSRSRAVVLRSLRRHVARWVCGGDQATFDLWRVRRTQGYSVGGPGRHARKRASSVGGQKSWLVEWIASGAVEWPAVDAESRSGAAAAGA